MLISWRSHGQQQVVWEALNLMTDDTKKKTNLNTLKIKYSPGHYEKLDLWGVSENIYSCIRSLLSMWWVVLQCCGGHKPNARQAYALASIYLHNEKYGSDNNSLNTSNSHHSLNATMCQALAMSLCTLLSIHIRLKKNGCYLPSLINDKVQACKEIHVLPNVSKIISSNSGIWN